MDAYRRLAGVMWEVKRREQPTLWDEVYNGVADHQIIAKMTYSVDF